MKSQKVYLIPCSGIGKVFGSIGREAAYLVVNELAPKESAIECLPLIVKGDPKAIDALKRNKVIVIDGCPLKCAFNNVSTAVGKVDAQFMTTDIVKENRALKPEPEIVNLGENAKKLSRKLAEKIGQKVHEILKGNTEAP